MRIPITSAVDPALLASQFSTALGIPVAVSVRNPGVDDAGKAVPGVVVLIDGSTGDELPDQDGARVANVIAKHSVPPPQKTPHRVLADTLGAAASIADMKAALLAFAGGVADAEDQQRNRKPGRPPRDPHGGGGGQQG